MGTPWRWGSAWLAIGLATCQMETSAPTTPAAPAQAPRDAPVTINDAALDPASGVVPIDARVLVPTAADAGCMSDERQWGTTCCRTEGAPGRRRWMSCRGPQLGKECHKKGDCDITCGCDRALVHHDGKTGVTGHCTGFMPSGEWLCVIDEAGKVGSLIID